MMASIQGENESDSQWKLRKAFIVKYEKEFSAERLNSLSFILTNVVFLRCKYSPEIMELVNRITEEMKPEVEEANKKAINLTPLLPVVDLDSEDSEDFEDVDLDADCINVGKDFTDEQISALAPAPEKIPLPVADHHVRKAHAPFKEFSTLTLRETSYKSSINLDRKKTVDRQLHRAKECKELKPVREPTLAEKLREQLRNQLGDVDASYKEGPYQNTAPARTTTPLRLETRNGKSIEIDSVQSPAIKKNWAIIVNSAGDKVVKNKKKSRKSKVDVMETVKKEKQ